MIGKTASEQDYERGIFVEWSTEKIPTLSYDFFRYYCPEQFPHTWNDIHKVKINWHDLGWYIHCSPLSLYDYKKNHCPMEMIASLIAYDRRNYPPDSPFRRHYNYLVDRRYVVSTRKTAIYEVVGIWVHESHRKPWMPE